MRMALPVAPEETVRGPDVSRVWPGRMFRAEGGYADRSLRSAVARPQGCDRGHQHRKRSNDNRELSLLTLKAAIHAVAANAPKEPKLYVGIAYCACSQHKFFCKGKNSPAVLPLENRTLCTTAAIPRRQNYDRGTNRPLACQNTMIDSEVAGKNGISSPEPVLAAIRLSSRCLVA